MKKFLIFLVSIVVVVTLGLTTYYFLRNEEVIDFTVKEIYCNQGDIVTLAELGKVVKKENISNKTTYNYNAGGESVTALFEYQEDTGYYKAKAGGNPIVVITTSNPLYPEFKISVHIGDGSADAPYIVGNQADLMKIGNVEGAYGLDGSYSLANDIVLTDDFMPIGYNSTTGEMADFTGSFNGNGHTISGLNLTNGETEPVTRRILRAEEPEPSKQLKKAGLFISLGTSAKVHDLTLSNVTISGAFETAGALAGDGAGTVRNIVVTNANITNTSANGVTGGLFGKFSGVSSVLTVAEVKETTLTIGKDGVLIAEGTSVGGLIGKVEQAKVQATDAKVTISCISDSESNANAGGLVGEFVITATAGTIQESYAVCASENANCGGFIGKISIDGSFNPGEYNILKFLVGNYCVSANNKAIISKPGEFIDELFTRDDVFLIGSKASEADLKTSTYYYYSVGPDKHLWDSSIWLIESGSLPQLKFNNIALEEVNSVYYLKNLDDETVEDFIALIEKAIAENNGVLSGSYFINDDVDLTGYDWKAVSLKDCILDFGGNRETVIPHTIRNLDIKHADVDGNMGLFTTMENSAILNLNLEGVKVSADATNVGAVAGTVKESSDASAIINVNVNYASAISGRTMDYFGGLVGFANSVTIENCKVKNLNTSGSTIRYYAGGAVAELVKGTINDVKVDVKGISASNAVAGLVAVNGGTIKSAGTIENAGVVINYVGKDAVSVGGVVAVNNGSILSGEFENVTINVNSSIASEVPLMTNSFNDLKIVNIEAMNTLKVGGVVGINTGAVENVTISGSGINIAQSTGNSMIVGGLVGVNQGSLKSSKCDLTKVGDCVEGKDYVVGGIAGTNSTAKSSIYQCSVSADIKGNHVAGVVVSMDNLNATVSQVFVGKLTNGGAVVLAENEISGDKYVAGVCFNFNAGKMYDIQTVSKIYGTKNETKSSLVALIFPDEATLIRASINSYCDGYGVFYRETWKNFSQGNTNNRYNIYGRDEVAGTMQQVVFNTDTMAKAGKPYTNAQFIIGNNFAFNYYATYENTEESSYVLALDSTEFSRTSNYTSDYTLIINGVGAFGASSEKHMKTMNFNFDGGVWKYDNVIVLAFMIAE